MECNNFASKRSVKQRTLNVKHHLTGVVENIEEMIQDSNSMLDEHLFSCISERRTTLQLLPMRQFGCRRDVHSKHFQFRSHNRTKNLSKLPVCFYRLFSSEVLVPAWNAVSPAFLTSLSLPALKCGWKQIDLSAHLKGSAIYKSFSIQMPVFNCMFSFIVSIYMCFFLLLWCISGDYLSYFTLNE